MNKKIDYYILWQQYSDKVSAVFPYPQSFAVASKAVLNGESSETILQMLRFEPDFRRTQEQRGEERAEWAAHMARQ